MTNRPTVLSDRSIREQTAEGRIVVGDDETQPASIDLLLNRCFLVFSNSHQPCIDVREPPDNLTEEVPNVDYKYRSADPAVSPRV